MGLLEKRAPLIGCDQCGGVTTHAVGFHKGARAQVVCVCLLCLREAVSAIETRRSENAEKG
jgi:hypothetical protein